MRNRFPGTCHVCRVSVAVGGGDWTAGKTTCAAHMVAPVEDNRIRLTVAGHQAAVKPAAFLDNAFEKYRGAVKGLAFDNASKSYLASFEKVPSVIVRLQEAGFTVDVAPDVVAAIQAKSVQLKTDVADADERAEAADRLLRERGLYLFPFQRTGVKWLAARSGALLADEMGLGKTIQTLIALPKSAPVLVVGPAVAKGVWRRETAKWRPDYKVTVLSGRGSFRWPAPGEVVVTNYDILSMPEGTDEAPAGLVFVADEAHAIKSSKTLRGRRFRAISQLARKAGGKVWLLTATPELNNPSELWNILNSADIAKEAFGSWDNFVNVCGGYRDDYGYLQWGTPNADVVGGLLRKVQLRRLRTEVLPELPVKQWREISVDLDATTRKLCDKVIEAFAKASSKKVKASDLTEVEKENLLGDLAFASSKECPAFEEIAKARAALAKAKIAAMLELVEDYEEQGEPLVVFSAHRAPIDLLEGRPGWAVITGDVSPEQRTKIEEAFQRGELKGIACTIKAGGVAITLTRAAHALFVDLEWTPALNAQAEDRICRIGQSRGVLITILVADHVLDIRIAHLLAMKREYIEGTVDAARVRDEREIEIPVMPEIDFETLAFKAAEEAAKADKAIRESKERCAAFEAERDAAKAEKRVVRAELMPPGRRAAKNAREAWAAEALVSLAQLDPDRASEQNNIGFNGSDGGSGHRLATEAYLGLTDSQWELALAICPKYWRQIGRPPAEG